MITSKLTKSQVIEPPSKVVKDVHDCLVLRLAESFADTLKVRTASDPEMGLISYQFTDVNYECFARVSPLNDRAALVTIFVDLGRLYVGYRRSLKWLRMNRAGNSVGLFESEQTVSNKELHLISNRVTLLGDLQGIKEMLSDVHRELNKMLDAFEPYFQQLLRGARLAALEVESESDEAIRAILANPREFVIWAESISDCEITFDLMWAVVACEWICEWAGMLRWVERASKQERPEHEVTFLQTETLKGLYHLKRYSEMFEILEPIWNQTDEANRHNLICAKLACLHGLKRYDDLLEAVRSCEFDVNPRIDFWRAMALASLGQVEQSIGTFRQYETQVGVDIIGRKKLREALPQEKQD